MLIMTVFLAVACIFDILFHKIPNVLTGLMLAALCLFVCLTEDYTQLPGSLIRMLVTGALFYPFFKIGALGAGDVKLLAVCSGFLSGYRILYFVFLALATAAAAGVIRLVIKKEFVKSIRRPVIYIKKIMETGEIERYHGSTDEALKSGIALAGPMFISALIGIGGLY